jgi:hypothetical protein
VLVPQGFLPQLDEWIAIDSRERALSIEPGTPILIDPAGRIDPRLAYFLRRSRFGFLAEETKHAYAKDYRLFFTFLHQRDKYWDQADHEDIDDYESWRRRSEDNPRRIGGSKWARELAAFKLLYGWAVAVGHIDRSPVLTHTVRHRDGTVVEVANNRPKDVRASNVKWLTPRTYRLWRDIGLRGYTAAGLPQQRWRGRNDGRNAAFADLLFDSGAAAARSGLPADTGGAARVVWPGLLRGDGGGGDRQTARAHVLCVGVGTGGCDHLHGHDPAGRDPAGTTAGTLRPGAGCPDCHPDLAGQGLPHRMEGSAGPSG